MNENSQPLPHEPVAFQRLGAGGLDGLPWDCDGTSEANDVITGPNKPWVIGIKFTLANGHIVVVRRKAPK